MTSVILWGDYRSYNEEHCYTRDELEEIIETNDVLLKRYGDLKKYPKFDTNIHFAGRAQLLINVHRLFIANNKLQLESNTEEAFLLLMDDLKYHRVLMTQPGTWVSRAIHLVFYGLSLSQLEYAIEQYTDVALKNQTAIAAALTDLTVIEFNVEGIFREEFEILNSLLCVDERLGIESPDYCIIYRNADAVSMNFIVNQYYESYLGYKNALSQEQEKIVEHCNRFADSESKYTNVQLLLRLPIVTTYEVYDLLQVNGCSLIESYLKKADKHKELREYLEFEI